MDYAIFCDDGGGINTALGCIDISSSEGFVTWLLPNLLGIMGGIAFLLMLVGGIQVIASSGDPEKLKSGQQLITSAIAGLIFAIFSLFIFRLIGVDILKIPDLSK